MATTASSDQASPVIAMSTRQVVQVMVTGAIIGAVAWGLALLLDAYVYQAILCRLGDDSCAAAPTYALATANVLAAIVGLLMLVRLQVFRPLLIVLAAVVALWSLPVFVAGFAWYWAVLIVALLYALAYTAFSWLARLRSFALALIVIVVVIVALRFVMYS